MTEEFSSITELYERIKPALLSKVSELKLVGLNYIKDVDIWNYLKENKWCSAKNLSINDMVNDILELDNRSLQNYLISKINAMPRKVNLDE